LCIVPELLLLKLFFLWVFVNDCPNQTQISAQNSTYSEKVPAQDNAHSTQNSTHWEKIFAKAQFIPCSKEIMQIIKYLEEGSRQSSRQVPHQVESI
jgi:hypothetical protein